MSGVPLNAGLLIVSATLAVGVGAAGAASVQSVRLAAAADAAALAAVDTLVGLAPGLPCDRAAEASARGGARLEACDIDDAIATVAVTTTVGPFTARATARAGPPP